jgi:tRNA threonylcarbamoyladenosine biosynthesis protein TsaE
MNTDLSLQIRSTSYEQTEQIAANIGARLLGGELIVLKSDLGGGKTTFARGLVRGTGSTDMVSSPTFTISKVYDAPNFQIQHFDFYRLTEPGVIGAELQELVSDDGVVLVLEWPEIIDELLPTKKVIVTIENTGGDTRQMTITYPVDHAYLVEGFAE